jgi:hypothetical protein
MNAKTVKKECVMKTVTVEGVVLSENLIEQLNYMQQEKEFLDLMKNNAINLNGFLVEKMDFDESENRNYIIWLHFLNDVMKLLQSIEPVK